MLGELVSESEESGIDQREEIKKQNIEDRAT